MKHVKYIYNKYCSKYGKIKINFIIISSISFIITIIVIIIIFVIKKDNQNNTCYDGNTYITFTNYWIPKEGEKDLDDNDNIIYLNGSKNVKLLDENNNIISMVSKKTYNKFKEEGTGILENGTMVNLAAKNNKFEIVNINKYPFGIGSNDNPLNPFLSIALNNIPINTTLYIKDLDGIVLPNNKTHNGCVRVDDKGYGFGKCHIDFFVLKYINYEYLQKHLNKDKVLAKITKCSIINYITDDMYQWI